MLSMFLPPAHLQGPTQSVHAAIRGLTARALTTVICAPSGAAGGGGMGQGLASALQVGAGAGGGPGGAGHRRTRSHITSFSGLKSASSLGTLASLEAGSGLGSGLGDLSQQLGAGGGLGGLSSTTTACEVLEPCDITLRVKVEGAGPDSGTGVAGGGTTGGGAGGAAGAKATQTLSVHLDLSDIGLRLSPDVLQLMLTVRVGVRVRVRVWAVKWPGSPAHKLVPACAVLYAGLCNHLFHCIQTPPISKPQLQQLVAEPLIVPPADKPLLKCDTYERLWSTAAAHTFGQGSQGGDAASGGAAGGDGSAGQQPLALESVGMGGVDPLAGQRGMALWRPQPPQGYAILGDVPVAGAGAKPAATVAVIAINSGFVAWPVRYECCWSAGEGLALWRPVPPPGYVAMGCVASPGPLEPPPGRLVACVHERALVAATLGQCMLLCAAGNLWAVGNCASSLVCGTPDGHLPEGWLLRDLRSPLGVAPAALPPPISAAEQARQRQQQLQLQQERQQSSWGGSLLLSQTLGPRAAALPLPPPSLLAQRK